MKRDVAAVDIKPAKQDGSATEDNPGDAWINHETRALAQAVLALREEEETLRFLRDLCTVAELRELGERWHVARLLDAGLSYAEIARATGASSATISRVGQWLRYGRGGYRLVIDRLAEDAAPSGRR